jgi:mannose-6-phosphate isomerase-like protein (cupin superfamily)
VTDAAEPFAHLRLPDEHDVIAPDGSFVRLLLGRQGGTVAHFELPPAAVSVAVWHRTVEEIWYVVGGRGQMWRSLGEVEDVVDLEPGVCLTIPVGTAFQFRSTGPGPLEVVGVTMPPWPGDGEAVRADGRWEPTVWAGPGLVDG